jgi:DNA-directed RNA polymerase subunit RPC12/RpoP
MLERVETQPPLTHPTGGHVATKAICVGCERTVFLEENETGSCPVCSSPVIPALVEPLPATLEGYYLG